jgi:aspartyl-tRNA(Asn)/glutamyl-tRNA(Gln) amidotransferase subunit C
MSVDDTLIEKLEVLSRLKLESQEKKVLKNDIEQMISMFDKIASIDTENVEPLTHMTTEIDRYRDDQAIIMSAKEILLDAAPVRYKRYFSVPKVIE